MSIGIYKIENKLTHKVYIGQSVHIEKRWQEHCQMSTNSLIGKAIKKYGKDNFDFSVIEFVSDVKLLNELEAKYIKLYNSLVPNGYNILIVDNREHHQFNTYDYKIFQNIISDIKSSSLSFKEIASKYDLSLCLVYHLNRGTCHRLEGEIYPLRVIKNVRKQQHFCINCGLLLKTNSKLCPKCAHVKQRRVIRPDRDTLKNLIRKDSFTTIAKQFNVSDNAIKKWCKAVNLPYKKSEIKQYSNLAWQEI